MSMTAPITSHSGTLSVPSLREAERMREFFEEAGYTEDALDQHLGRAELPSARLRNIPQLLDRTSAPSTLNALLRWFWIGVSQSRRETEAIVPEWFVEAALGCGLLREVGVDLIPQAMLMPVFGLLVASDHTSHFDSSDAGLVLWPNPTTRLLARLTIRETSRSTLDVGTGTGVLSLAASSHSGKLTATDLNPRALEFAAFNARLNGIETLELAGGDAFEPVAGRSFDLIFSNPPFFISPITKFLFCDGGMDLDGLCRKLAKGAPAHLNEGGFFQMLCEWAQIKGQDWRDRLQEWTEGSGCDVWVVWGVTQDPARYALQRVRETAPSETSDLALYDGYMSYYRERGVEAIHDGMIVMRKRLGKNWFKVDQITRPEGAHFGEIITQIFAAKDFLEAADDDETMLSMRLRLSPDVRLDQTCERVDGGWRAVSVALHLTRGFGKPRSVQPMVAEFLATCDGQVTTEVLVNNFAAKVRAPVEIVRKETIAMLRELIDQGFIIPETAPS